MRVTATDADTQRAFEIVKDDPCSAESAAATKAGEMLQAMSRRPGLLAGFSKLDGGFNPGGIVERDLR